MFDDLCVLFEQLTERLKLEAKHEAIIELWTGCRFKQKSGKNSPNNGGREILGDRHDRPNS